jgi:hypothetical protein
VVVSKHGRRRGGGTHNQTAKAKPVYRSIDLSSAEYFLTWDRTGTVPKTIHAVTPAGVFALGLHVGDLAHANAIMARGQHRGSDWRRSAATPAKLRETASTFECGAFVD